MTITYPRMLRQLSTAVVAIGLLTMVAGWPLGYRALSSYAMFGVLNVLVLIDGWMLFDLFFPSNRLSDAAIRVAVLAFALVAACGMVLGAAGRLTPLAYGSLLAVATVILAIIRTRRAGASRTLDATSLGVHPVLVVVPPILVFVLCVGLVHPPVAYDSLTYHLFFPARWLQDHAISIIPTHFGDQAPAYAPADGELLYLWLMLPFHGDVLARAGEFPFYAFGALTLYGISRRLGAAPSRALYAAGLFLLARPVIEQAVGADVDLVFAATFLAAVYFGLTASQTGRTADIVLWGISIGLCFGTKVLGVIYSPLLFAFVLARPVRWRALWALPGVLALALPWYIRNWVVAGSPLYPVGLTFAGITIAPGGWDRSVSSENWAHSTDLRVLPGILRDGALGADLLAVWAPFAVLGLLAVLRKRRWATLGLGLVVPLLMCAIYWYVVPYNDLTDTRYLFGGVGLAMLLAPAAFELHERLAPWMHAGLTVGLLWLIALGQPLVPSRYLLLFAALGGVALVLHRVFSRSLAVTSVAFCAACAAVVLVSVRTCATPGCAFVDVAAFDRPTMFEGWDWIDAHTSHARIAYSGNNVPYRLLGSHFENDVFYVNIDDHPQWVYHDYERAERLRPGYKPPQRPNAPFFRLHGSYEDWARNMASLRVNYLFLTQLSPLMEDDYQRDESGFPIEAGWAAAHPQIFKLVFENPEVRIYSVGNAGR
jgi:hypothetical protein